MQQPSDEDDEALLVALVVPGGAPLTSPTANTSSKRKGGRAPNGFTQMRNDAAIAGFRALGCPQAMVWFYIHYRVWAERNRTVPLATKTLAGIGVDRKVKYRALTRLEQAGLIRVERRGKRSPLVTLL